MAYLQLPPPNSPLTATYEWFEGVPQASTASNRTRIYDDMNSIGLYDNHATGTGATITVGTALDNGHVGLLELETGTTNTGAANMTYGTNATGMILGGGNFYFETLINIPTLAVNGGDDYKYFAGIHDGWIFTVPPNNGFFFEYFVDTSTHWIINSANGGTTSSTTTSVVVATGYTKLAIAYNVSNTTATFYINGTSVGTISTNISTNPISPCWTIVKTNGTTNRVIYQDYIDFMIDYTTGR